MGNFLGKDGGNPNSQYRHLWDDERARRNLERATEEALADSPAPAAFAPKGLAVVTGAGGFIGGHLCRRLKADGWEVRGVDLKRHEYFDGSPGFVDEFFVCDLRNAGDAHHAVAGADRVYDLACDMGGMGFISKDEATIYLNNARISTNMLTASLLAGVGRYLYTSSACVYPERLQHTAKEVRLAESQVYPADPDTGYGWQKLMHERACHYAAREQTRTSIRIARLHNTYGPFGTWKGGREKAPAALCRKVAEAKRRGLRHVDIWGDGQQMRSYLHVEDCVEALCRLMDSDYRDPLNVGSDRAVSVDDLTRIVMGAARYQVALKHVEGPVGVYSRSSDNTLIEKVLRWQPHVSLEVGIGLTYDWIEEQERKG